MVNPSWIEDGDAENTHQPGAASGGNGGRADVPYGPVRRRSLRNDDRDASEDPELGDRSSGKGVSAGRGYGGGRRAGQRPADKYQAHHVTVSQSTTASSGYFEALAVAAPEVPQHVRPIFGGAPAFSGATRVLFLDDDALVRRAAKMLFNLVQARCVWHA